MDKTDIDETACQNGPPLHKENIVTWKIVQNSKGF